MKKTYTILFYIAITIASAFGQPKSFSISKNDLKDKIMGGWAGQTIGVTFGSPMEFHYNGTIIDAYQPIPWYDGYLKKLMTENPGIYDDLYMDLTFVEVFNKEGLDAPIASHANAFANAGYMLWHANQAARYNILHGIMPPQSGNWKNNPHADCIDYQIECDFAGLMSPAMPNVASNISTQIGHIMNYGDGFYGGVYLGACYSLAFKSNDIHYIINEALKSIPKESDYYKCISDVIKWNKAYPTDWKKTWFEVQNKWAEDIGCPDGVFDPFNIDAKVNSAYVVIGLLYGNGDFTKTLEIATRCGQDADCNPSSAGGILGAMLGYKNIPAYWKQGLKEAEDIKFKYTSTSLNDVYGISYNHAIENIKRNGGKIQPDSVNILQENIKAVALEKSFPTLYPIEKIEVNSKLNKEYSFDFEGTGFVVRGEVAKEGTSSNESLDLDIYVDGKFYEKANLPISFITRRHELTWNYDLPEGKHHVAITLSKGIADKECKIWNIIIYSNKALVKTTDKLFKLESK